jgi:hypothetical protein
MHCEAGSGRSVLLELSPDGAIGEPTGMDVDIEQRWVCANGIYGCFQHASDATRRGSRIPRGRGCEGYHWGPLIPDAPLWICAAVGPPILWTTIPKQTEVAVGKMIVAEPKPLGSERLLNSLHARPPCAKFARKGSKNSLVQGTEAANI